MASPRNQNYTLQLNTNSASSFAPNYLHHQTSTFAALESPKFSSSASLDMSFKLSSLTTSSLSPLQLPSFRAPRLNFTYVEIKPLNLKLTSTFETLKLGKFELPQRELALNSLQIELPKLNVPQLNLSLATRSLQEAKLQSGEAMAKSVTSNRNQYNLAVLNGIKQGTKDLFHTLTHLDDVAVSTLSLIADTAVLAAVASRHQILSCNNAIECSSAALGQYIVTDKPNLNRDSNIRMSLRAQTIKDINTEFERANGPKKLEIAVYFVLGGGSIKYLKLIKPMQVVSKKSRLKAVDLPTQGLIRFVPDKKYDPVNPLPRLNGRGGYIDRFDNVWTKGPARGSSAVFEWDVQLSKRGKKMFEWLKPGEYINVSTKGEITHGLPTYLAPKQSMFTFAGVLFPKNGNASQDSCQKPTWKQLNNTHVFAQSIFKACFRDNYFETIVLNAKTNGDFELIFQEPTTTQLFESIITQLGFKPDPIQRTINHFDITINRQDMVPLLHTLRENKIISPALTRDIKMLIAPRHSELMTLQKARLESDVIIEIRP